MLLVRHARLLALCHPEIRYKLLISLTDPILVLLSEPPRFEIDTTEDLREAEEVSSGILNMP